MKRDYKVRFQPLDYGPNPYLIEGEPAPSRKVTGDFSTTRLTRAIDKLFGGTGEPETEKTEETEEP